MVTLRKAAGLSALAEAGIYIAMFVFYGAFWNYPAKGSVAEKIAFLGEHQTSLMLSNLIGFVLFGVLLAVLVVGLHRVLKAKEKSLSQIAAVFGFAWVVLVMASGMIANIGLAQMLKLAATQQDQAWTVWLTLTAVIEGLGGGNEIVGGVWVLLASIAAWRAQVFPTWLNALGLLVGSLGIATMYPAGVLTEMFGVTQIVWFALLGIFLWRHPARDSALL